MLTDPRRRSELLVSRQKLTAAPSLDMPKSDEEIWMELAVLFFGSSKMETAENFDSVVDSLKISGWTANKTEDVLVGIVAPHAKRWLGYGLPLAMGEEIDFWDKEILIPKMRATERARVRYAPRKFPFYYFILPDFLNRRLLRRLGLDRLLSRLQ